MRSPDDTYYNINRLHVIFGISSALLVGVTVWMFAVDHQRPWKEYQRTYRDRIQPWLAESRLDQQKTAEFNAEEAKLRGGVDDAAAKVPEASEVEEFSAALRAAGDKAGATAVETAYASLRANFSKGGREKLLGALQSGIGGIERRQEELDRQRRDHQTDFDRARSQYEIAVGQAAPADELFAARKTTAMLRKRIDSLTGEIERLDASRRQLAGLLASIRAEEDTARTALKTHLLRVERLESAVPDPANDTGRTIARMPFVDSFGRSLAVEQIWLPKLTIDYHFRRVARFDRCTTCHLGIDQVEPGAEDRPAIAPPEQITVELATLAAPPEESELSIESLYGLALASRGVLEEAQPTISVVEDGSAAARAGLYPGDVIRTIDDAAVTTRPEAIERLMRPDRWGAPLRLKIARGLPQPYCGHPRLDLFVGSASPHPAAEYGCTICHAGQGSATQFEFASHNPNGPEDRTRWAQEYGWFRNGHWDFPMLARRFSESSCLKCHHDVTDLEPTERYPDPPAPKLLAGYHLVRQNGCFGCHELNGFDPAGKRIGPDLRLEPLVTEAAGQIAALTEGSGEDRRLAEAVVANPHDTAVRDKLVRAGQRNLATGSLPPAESREIERLLDILRNGGPHPGTMRKVGPSLRHVADLFGDAVLERWIANPKAIRSTTRMPQFFGLHEHLAGEELQKSQDFEAVEIQAIRSYLRDVSQPVDLLPVPAEVTEQPSAERGKELFVRRGCVACHRHADVPEGKSTIGPELTGLGSMITADKGLAWLASWLRDPAHHSPRTAMPNSLLVAESLGTDTEDGRPRVSDPAADLAAYLFQSKGEVLAAAAPLEEADLNALAHTYLSKQFSANEADEILAGGIQGDFQSADLGDAVDLLPPISREKKLRYVGRRTIRKRGCFGCHDIPGFEGAQAIGPALTDWGRKQESLLAFEQVHRHLEENPPTDTDGPPADRQFYLEAITEGRREGFLWQKLRRPRSFDYRKTEHKGYNDQLTMGQFSLTPTEREQIMTFVLGMVADAPGEPYVHVPDRRGKAIAEGRKVLDRYGCAECHTMRMSRWQFRYDPESWEDPSPPETFDFAMPQFTPEAVAESLIRDRTGWGQAEVMGREEIDTSGETILDEDDDGNPLYVFSLWKPAVINGQVWPVGGAQVPIAEPNITRRYPAWGGAFARLLYPYVAEEAGTAWLEAWGQVPPALVHEGSLVQPEWLYSYLLQPTQIRPSVALRMPQFNLSPDEAAVLVDYFAAVASSEFPYVSRPPTVQGDTASPRRAALMDQAMRVITDRKTYCAKCHLIGDYDPGGQTQTILAPNLANVGRRIRADYLRRWLADPKSVLPYTGMPVNFPPDGPPMGQDLLPGSSAEQLEAVLDLLLRYDAFMQNRTSIRALIDAASRASDDPATD